MSEILDKIRIVQEKTGCSVVKGKELLDMAGGDIDLAVAIYEEEKANKPAQPAPQPQPQQPKTLSQGLQQQTFHTEQINNQTVVVPTNTVPVNRVVGGSNNYRPQAPEVSVPRPNEPGSRVVQSRQYQPMNQPTAINVPPTSGQRILMVDNSPKPQVVYNQQMGQPSEISVPRSSGQMVTNNAQPQMRSVNQSQPMPTIIPRPLQPGMAQPVQQANTNGAAPTSIAVPRPAQPGEHLAQPNHGSAPAAPVVIPRPVQPGSNQPIMAQQTIQTAQPVVQQPQAPGQPVVLGSVQQPKQPNNAVNRPGQPVTRFKLERPETQFFQSTINNNNQPQYAPTSISVPRPQKQDAHVVIKGTNDQAKPVQMPTPQIMTGPNSHFVMAKPNSTVGTPTPVIISQSGQMQNGLQGNQRIQQAPQPSGNAPSVIPLPSRPGSKAVVNNKTPEEGENK